MRKWWPVVLVVVVAAVAVPAVAFHSGSGGWLRNALLELHGRGGGAGHGGAAHGGATPATAPTEAAVLPFELVTGHIVIQASVNNSPPLSFILDTGDKYGIIDADRARELRLTLGGAIPILGVGPRPASGARVEDATFGVAGLPGFSQPVTLAMPLADIAARLGHAVDGIIGADFISEFVVELDYEARTVTLHDKRTFTYHGPGEALPIRLNSSGHPIVRGSVTPVGGEGIQAEFAFDAGSGGALALHSPFADAHHLPGPALPTVRAVGQGGAGGSAAGRIGRVSALTIGRVTLHDPVALFSEDRAGAFAATDAQGNIGQKIIGRFRVFLDYGRARIILEPTDTLDDPFEAASAGVRIDASGPDYRTFSVADLLEAAPCSEAGLKKRDVIVSIDGRPAADLTLTKIYEMFERPLARTITIRRGAEMLTATVTPRKLM
jgi:hypothetical protein